MCRRTTMKRVTIQAPSPEQSRPATPLHDDRVSVDLIVPRHALLPGADGYLTPPAGGHGFANNPTNEKSGGTLSGSNPHLRLHGLLNTTIGHHSANTSTTSLSERLLERLQWRERLRHFTWTFFTMTMATGGIANVLSAGMQYE